MEILSEEMLLQADCVKRQPRAHDPEEKGDERPHYIPPRALAEGEEDEKPDRRREERRDDVDRRQHPPLRRDDRYGEAREIFCVGLIAEQVRRGKGATHRGIREQLAQESPILSESGEEKGAATGVTGVVEERRLGEVMPQGLIFVARLHLEIAEEFIPVAGRCRRRLEEGDRFRFVAGTESLPVDRDQFIGLLCQSRLDRAGERILRRVIDELGAGPRSGAPLERQAEADQRDQFLFFPRGEGRLRHVEEARVAARRDQRDEKSQRRRCRHEDQRSLQDDAAVAGVSDQFLPGRESHEGKVATLSPFYPDDKAGLFRAD